MPTGVYERKPKTPEEKARLSAAISAGKKGKKFSAEHRAALSQAKLGIPMITRGMKRTPEQRARMSAAHAGKAPPNKGRKGQQVAWNKGIKTGIIPPNKGQRTATAVKERISKTLRDKREKLAPHSVYYLLDPQTGAIRYVGFSENPEKRFREHLIARNKTHKALWIAKLAEAGLQPSLAIKCIVQSKLEACRVETALIARLRQSGIDLTNITPGGEGGNTGRWDVNTGRNWAEAK